MGHDLDVPRGLAALSLDALSSVAYGPEAIMALVLLVISYSQVITAHPDGGGAYAVSKDNLGRWPALVAAAFAGGRLRAHRGGQPGRGRGQSRQRVPGLAHHLVLVSMIGLALLRAVNMFGISESAKVLILPAAIFVLSILVTIVIGLVQPHATAVIGRSEAPFKATEALGVVLILKRSPPAARR